MVRWASLLSVLAVAGSLAATAAAQGTSKIIKLVAVQVSEKHPTSKTFVDTENDFIGTKKVGTDTLTCTIVSSSKAHCKFVFKLASGTINGAVNILFTATKGQGTITGGSGAYAGATGTLAYASLKGKGTRTSLVLTLT